MTVLYRKYRPKTFAEVAGQEHVKAALAHEAATGRIAHSYLFSGPRGVGKTTIARIFAKAINCGARTPDGDPCGACGACLEIAENRALDVIEIDAASHTGVENVREQVIESARFAPSKLAYKVFIIDEVHMLSTSAFNALLKTLEEPPSKVVFILATTEPHKLPATIVSRCQRYDFRKIPAAALIERLNRLAADEDVTVDPDVMETVARMSEGCLRDAESLLGQLFALGKKRLSAEAAALVLPMISAEAVDGLFAALSGRDGRDALAVWERLMTAGSDPQRVVAELSERCRAEMLRKLKGEEAGGSPAETAALLERVIRAGAEMRRMDPPELAFELLIVEWCGGNRSETPERRTPSSRPPEPPSQPPARPSSFPGKDSPPAVESAAPGRADSPKAEASDATLEAVKGRWTEVLNAAGRLNHGLPYMLGVAEVLDCVSGTLTIGFQYAMYRDRLNEHRHRETLEAALSEVLGSALKVRAVLVAQRTDGLVEPSPQIHVEASANLPEGFADLVKEFGGTVA